jgi:hypothetical protein
MFFRTCIRYRLEKGLLKFKCPQENRTFLGKNFYWGQIPDQSFFYSEGKQELIDARLE